VAVFAFAAFHPGRAFDDSFGNLSFSIEKSSKGEDAEMNLMPQQAGVELESHLNVDK
jgi:hypothetical protein